MLKDWRAERKEQSGYFSSPCLLRRHLVSGCISYMFPVPAGCTFSLCPSLSYLRASAFTWQSQTQSPMPVPSPKFHFLGHSWLLDSDNTIFSSGSSISTSSTLRSTFLHLLNCGFAHLFLFTFSSSNTSATRSLDLPALLLRYIW